MAQGRVPLGPQCGVGVARLAKFTCLYCRANTEYRYTNTKQTTLSSLTQEQLWLMCKLSCGLQGKNDGLQCSAT